MTPQSALSPLNPPIALATTFDAQPPSRIEYQPRPKPLPLTNPHLTKAFRSLLYSLSSLTGSFTFHHDSANTSSQYHGASLISLMTRTLAHLMHPQTNQRSRSSVFPTHNIRGRNHTANFLPTSNSHIATHQPTNTPITAAHRLRPATRWKTQAQFTQALLTLTQTCLLR